MSLPTLLRLVSRKNPLITNKVIKIGKTTPIKNEATPSRECFFRFR